MILICETWVVKPKEFAGATCRSVVVGLDWKLGLGGGRGPTPSGGYRLWTGEPIIVGGSIVLITLRRDEMPSRRSVMSTVVDSPVVTPEVIGEGHEKSG
jgi:hypothetical protein